MSRERPNRVFFFANKIHKEVFLPIFLASLLPMMVTLATVFILVFGVSGKQVELPEPSALRVYPDGTQTVHNKPAENKSSGLCVVSLPRTMVALYVAVPAVLALMLILVYKVTHSILGPYERLLREMDECMEGRREPPIKIRPKDKFVPLVERINALLERYRNV